MKKVAYISGKITGVKNGNTAKFAAAANLLREHGHTPINPHDVCSDVHPEASWETFMKRNIRELVRCDFVAVLDDWHKSRGAQMEVEIAVNLGIPVIAIEDIAQMTPMDFGVKTFTTYKGAILNTRV